MSLVRPSFGVGSIFRTIGIAAGGIGPGMLTGTFTFLATPNQSNVKLFFQIVWANNRGPIIGNVSLPAVPIPGADARPQSGGFISQFKSMKAVTPALVKVV